MMKQFLDTAGYFGDNIFKTKNVGYVAKEGYTDSDSFLFLSVNTDDSMIRAMYGGGQMPLENEEE